MEEIHKELLRENFTYLKDNVKPFDVIDYLYEKNILPADEVERLRKKKTISDIVDRLVRVVLPRSGPDAFSWFVIALDETKQSHVSNDLRDKEKQKRQKVIKGMLYTCLLTDTILLFILGICLSVC